MMNKLILSGQRSGSIEAKASKSVAHRLLICAALSGNKKTIRLNATSEDIKATADCLNAMGAEITFEEGMINISPIKKSQIKDAIYLCKESGSTLRFLLPLVGALGTSGTFQLEGRLAERPQKVFTDILNSHGMAIEQHDGKIICKGSLETGTFIIPGNISSQYISGLLFALPLLHGDSNIKIEGDLQSKDYIKLTEQAIRKAGIRFEKKENEYLIFGDQSYDAKDKVEVEGDWSNAAIFLCAGALSENGVKVFGLDIDSFQGDKKIIDILRQFGANVNISEDHIEVKKAELKGIEIDASDIPDIIPALSVVGVCAEGTTRIYNAERLKMKESDRISGTAEILNGLGAEIETTDSELIIKGGSGLKGGKADPLNDHRMAMMAALAACICEESVEIENAECVNKSYPGFWNDMEQLKISI